MNPIGLGIKIDGRLINLNNLEVKVDSGGRRYIHEKGSDKEVLCKINTLVRALELTAKNKKLNSQQLDKIYQQINGFIAKKDPNLGKLHSAKHFFGDIFFNREKKMETIGAQITNMKINEEKQLKLQLQFKTDLLSLDFSKKDKSNEDKEQLILIPIIRNIKVILKNIDNAPLDKAQFDKILEGLIKLNNTTNKPIYSELINKLNTLDYSNREKAIEAIKQCEKSMVSQNDLLDKEIAREHSKEINYIKSILVAVPKYPNTLQSISLSQLVTIIKPLYAKPEIHDDILNLFRGKEFKAKIEEEISAHILRTESLKKTGTPEEILDHLKKEDALVDLLKLAKEEVTDRGYQQMYSEAENRMKELVRLLPEEDFKKAFYSEDFRPESKEHQIGTYGNAAYVLNAEKKRYKM